MKRFVGLKSEEAEELKGDEGGKVGLECERKRGFLLRRRISPMEMTTPLAIHLKSGLDDVLLVSAMDLTR